MLKIGLTGGIATGKSYVVSVLRELGCEVIDADALAHEVIEPGRPAFDEIVGHFGKDVVGDDGKIDRVKLGAIVFADKSQREKLNSIVHPRVYEAQLKWFAELYARNPEAIAVVDAALMIETGSYKRFDKVVVVYCDADLQRQRLMLRNNLTLEQAQARISAQMPSDEKLKFADYSINTSFSFEDTREKVVGLYRELQSLNASQ
jgi:dephospho-CoA kinase